MVSPKGAEFDRPGRSWHRQRSPGWNDDERQSPNRGVTRGGWPESDQELNPLWISGFPHALPKSSRRASNLTVSRVRITQMTRMKRPWIPSPAMPEPVDRSWNSYDLEHIREGKNAWKSASTVHRGSAGASPSRHVARRVRWHLPGTS